MILILSTTYDDDTNYVIDHLINLNAKFIRINDIDLFNGKTKLYYELNENKVPVLFVENNYFGKVDLKNIECVWFRKFGFFDKFYEELNVINTDFYDYLKTEYYAVIELVIDFFKDKKWLNNYRRVKEMNKTRVLEEANRIGLYIPTSIITNKKIILNKKLSYITKPIKDGRVINLKKNSYFLMTEEIVGDFFQEYEEFFPSLIQEKIEKEYELRIFHLVGKNYAMAIFSQSDSQTKTDFRNYNYKKPNRLLPYVLPKEINHKLNMLMKNLKLDTGSIDMIKGLDGKYYFLEVNPSGQFRMTSLPCNYNLHYEVACYLKKYENGKNITN